MFTFTCAPEHLSLTCVLARCEAAHLLHSPGLITTTSHSRTSPFMHSSSHSSFCNFHSFPPFPSLSYCPPLVSDHRRGGEAGWLDLGGDEKVGQLSPAASSYLVLLFVALTVGPVKGEHRCIVGGRLFQMVLPATTPLYLYSHQHQTTYIPGDTSNAAITIPLTDVAYCNTFAITTTITTDTILLSLPYCCCCCYLRPLGTATHTHTHTYTHRIFAILRPPQQGIDLRGRRRRRKRKRKKSRK